MEQLNNLSHSRKKQVRTIEPSDSETIGPTSLLTFLYAFKVEQGAFTALGNVENVQRAFDASGHSSFAK